MKKLFKIIPLTFLMLLFLGSNDAFGISYVFPTVKRVPPEKSESIGTPTSNIKESVALSGYACPQNTGVCAGAVSLLWGLDTGQTRYKVYIPVGQASTITIEHACEGRPHSGLDPGSTDPFKTGFDFEFPINTSATQSGVSQTKWDIYATAATEAKTGTPLRTINSFDKVCDTDPPVGPGTVSQSYSPPVGTSTPSNVPGHESWVVYIVQVDEISESGPAGAGKGFRVKSSLNVAGGLTIDGGYVTPAEFPTIVGVGVLNNDIFDTDFPDRGDTSRPYALIDGIRQGSRETDYSFSFRADCRMPDASKVYLKWFDADIGLTKGLDMEMRLKAGGVDVSLQAYATPDDPSTVVAGSVLATTGVKNGVVEGNELNGGKTGNGRYGIASFTAYRGVDYELVWNNVTTDNALQFWLPFSELNFVTDCPDPLTSISGTCDAITGYYVYVPIPDDKYKIFYEFKLGSGGAWGTEASVTANSATPDPPGKNYDNGFKITVPAAYKSSTTTTYARVYIKNADGSRSYINGWSNHQLSSTPCPPAPLPWTYSVSLSGVPAPVAGPPYTDIRAGDILALTSVVTNNSANTGLKYTHVIKPVADGLGNVSRANANLDFSSATTGSTNVDNIVWWAGNAALAAGASGTAKTSNLVVINAPKHDAQICYQAAAEPGSGTAAGVTTDVIQNNTSTNIPVCFEVYNERFVLDADAVPPGVAIPGQTITFDSTIENSGSVNNSTIGSVGRAISAVVTVTKGGTLSSPSTVSIPATMLANGVISFDVDVLVSSSASPGDDVCISIDTILSSGYSDGDTAVDVDATPEEFCVAVVEQPYFTAHKHDVWAGAVWDIASAPCALTSNLEGSIQSVFANINTKDYGSFGEYAAFAIEEITGFGTADAPGQATLSFANENTPPIDNAGLLFGAGGSSGGGNPRCIHDYFNELWTGATSGNMNSVTQSGVEKTIYLKPSSGIESHNNNATVKKRITVVIDGDLHIRKNLKYNTSAGAYTYDSATGTVTKGPSLAIIVRGDIFIDKKVTEINGLFIAQPRADGSGGIIDTCTTGNSTPIPLTALSTTVCNEDTKPLIIKGAVIAEQIRLRRTYGGILSESQGLSNGGAEQFIFDPMLYAFPPLFEPAAGAEGRAFPFLQIKDLPPLF